MIANFMALDLRASAGSWRKFELVVFDDRIGQEIARNLVQLCVIGGTGKLDLNSFSHADAADVLQAEVFHGFRGGSALRIEHRWLRHHGYNGFHGGRISFPRAWHKRIMSFFASDGSRKRLRPPPDKRSKKPLRSAYKRSFQDPLALPAAQKALLR